MAILPILCVAGESGSGKTTLLERLIPVLVAGGMRVGVVKRSAGRLAVGPSGKDSSRLAVAGARPAIAAGANELIVQDATGHWRLLDLAAEFCADCDLVLAEGYKHSPHDKILLVSADDCARLQAGPQSSSAGLLVVGEPDCPAGVVDRNDIAGMEAWIRKWLDRRHRLGAGVVGAILVGGTSRRMGTDKATMRVQRRSVLAHLAELLGDRLEEVWIVGRRVIGLDLPQCLHWHLDLRPDCGPLGGIATALRVAEARAVLVVACDMPGVRGDLLDHLLSGRDPSAAATVLLNPATGRLEPLMAIYEPHARKSIEQTLEEGRFTVRDWLTAAGAHRLTVPEALADQLVNVNTPAELAEFKASIKGAKA